MNSTSHDERMALRNASTLASAQNQYDNAAEPEMSDDEAGLRYLIEAAEDLIGRAERCLAAGDLAAAIDLLVSAGNELSGAGYAE